MKREMYGCNNRWGFTLAELLIALAILGVIATFTIPKILDSGSSGQNIAIVKEGAAMVSGAYQNYKLQQSISASTSVEDFLPYMNYVKLETAVSFDDVAPTGSDVSCSLGVIGCMRLHNGAIAWYRSDETFGSTDTTSGLRFSVDADGKLGDIHSVQFVLYTTGRITTRGHLLPNSYTSTGAISIQPTMDPTWFNWSN